MPDLEFVKAAIINNLTGFDEPRRILVEFFLL
jgi:hypothetical protein